MKFSIENLDRVLTPLWEGDTVYCETVLFLGKGEKKQLFYEPLEIMSIHSYDTSKVYTEGEDYILEDGKLVLTENTSIPYMTEESYYQAPSINDFLQTRAPGETEWRNTFWGGGKDGIKKYQVAVTYRHNGTWQGFCAPSMKHRFERIIGKLSRGENATVFFYGDSITVGANSSSLDGHDPLLPTWAELVSLALAKKFGYTLRYVSTDFAGGSRLPTEEISFGDRGVITVINTAVGGWTVRKGIEMFEVHCELFLRKYGCDLLFLGFGMNDKRNTPEEEKELVSSLLDMFLDFSDPDIMLIATMLPNPNANERWNLNQHLFEAEFLSIAEALTQKGHSAAVSPLTSVSRSVLDRKEYRDITGNNVNHPNDFFIRIYASTILKTLLGDDK